MKAGILYMAETLHHAESELKPRVAVYARFSCDKQRDASIEDQVSEAERYCSERGYEIVKVYPDYAISGRSDDRPQFLQMIEDARQGAFDTVLVWKMDRFARNMQDQYYYEKLINDAGVRLESVKEHISGNSIEASMSKGMLAIFAQIRSQQSAEDTMRGMLGKARKCQYLGVTQFGYSHDGDTITLDPVQAPIVREIHTRYLSGDPQKSIVEWLNSIDVRGNRGRPVGFTFVSNILKNDLYCGVYKWGKVKDERGKVVLGPDGNPMPLVRVEGGMPAIVTPEEKAECIRRMGFRKRANPNSDYPLSGKMFCAVCGSPMHGETCTNHMGTVYHRYCCQGKRKACSGVYWKEQTEAAITDTIRKLLARPEVAETIADRFEKYRARKRPEASIEAANSDLRTICRQRDNLVKAVQDGMPYAHVREKMEKLDAEQAGVERKIAELERSVCEITRADVLRVLSLLADGMRSDAEILKAFLSQVWVDGDQALAVMNFMGKSSTQFEVESVLKKMHEPAGCEQVRASSLWLPKKKLKTNSDEPCFLVVAGSSIALMESGIGFIIPLKAA